MPGLERRAARGLLAGDPLADIEVVFDLATVVVVFGFAGVVITDRRIDADPVEDVPVGLKVREEPVVVFFPSPADRNAEELLAGIDVVAGRQDEPEAVRVDGHPKRIRDLLLPVLPGQLLHADAEVANDGKCERCRVAIAGSGCVRNRLSYRPPCTSAFSPATSPIARPRPTPLR